jgi:hypothetical protein
LFFAEHLSTTLVQTTINTTNGVFGALNFHYNQLKMDHYNETQNKLTKINRFLQTRFRKQTSSISSAAHSGDNLPSTTVDGISVQLEKLVHEKLP